MGSLPAEEPPQGCLYLNRSVFNQFEEVKTKRQYDTDHLLEQLIGLYCKQAGETKGLDVRLDLAIKFLSLQSLTPFENSNDLMTHLLAIHSSIETSQETERPSVETSENTEQLRPKKNKRKPDYVHKKPYAISTSTKNSILNSVIENLPANRSRSPSVSFSEDSGCFDTSKEEPKPLINGLGEDDKGDYKEMTGLDLSVVKKEEDGAGVKRLKTDKDHLSALQQSTPMTQLKPLDNRNQQRNLPPTWRSNSVPAGDYTPVVSPQQSLSLQTSPKNYILNHIAQNSDPGLRRDGIFDRDVSPIAVDQAYDGENNESNKYEEEESEAENYNYVLTELDSPESPLEVEEGDTPMSMKMPVRMPFPASKKHSNLSDLSLTTPLKIVEDEEPQDLTSPQKHNQSKIISLGQSSGMPPLQAPGSNQPVFPNMPALRQAMLPALFKHPKGTLIGEPQVSRRNDPGRQPRIITLPLGQGPGKRPFLLPKNAQQNLVPVSPMLSPPGPPPKLIPASSVANMAFQASMGLTSPNSISGNPTALVAVDPHSHQILTNKKSFEVPNGGIMVQYDLTQEGDEEQQTLRRKRKKMDDTTSFRDPPESSLSFNGPNKYRFYCDVCDTGFTRRYTYNRHRCKGKVEKHYCQLCDKAYLSKYKLKDHILVKHEGQTVACPDCGKRFSSRSSMEMHKKQQHEGQFSIFCKVCGKGFNHTGHYYGHMNKHTNTKPFWCQKCGKRFYGSSYLHNHKQVCRGDEDWQHQCNICQRKFKCELYLKKHMKVHDPTPIYQQAMEANQGEAGEVPFDPTQMSQQELDSNQNEVSVAVDNDKSVPNLEDKSAEPVANMGDVADDMPLGLMDTGKVGGLNNNEFQQVDQAVA